MTEQTTPKIQNYTPSVGVAVDSENTLFDIRTLLTSGSVTASLVNTAGPSPIIGTATHPKIENLTPLPGKMIDKDNNIIDLLTLLTNGDLKITVGGIAPGVLTQSFLTATDETATLPNSIPLSSKASGFISVETGTGVIRTSVITGTTNQTIVNNGNGVNDNPVISLATDLQLPGSLLASDNVTFNPNAGNTNTFHCNTRSYFNLAAEFNSAIYINNSSGIIAATGYDLKLSCNDSAKSIQLLNDVAVDGVIARHTQTNNNITFGNATQNFNIGGVSMLNVSASGLVAGGNLNINGHQIISPNGQNIRIAPGITTLDWVELWANTVNIKESIIFNSTPTDNVTHVPGQNALWFNLNNTNVMIVSPSGLKLSNGATINNIDNTGTSFSETSGMTALGIQTAISDQIDMGTSFRGGYNASGNAFPTTGGTGTGGSIESGNWWYITVAGTLNGIAVSEGDEITALFDDPGQTGSNWLVSVQKVTSVFGRDGPVFAADGDYSFAYITGLPDTAGSGKLMRGNGTAWLETTATFADTYSAGSILYAPTANTVTSLANQANSLLITNSDGTVSWLELDEFKFPMGTINGPVAASVSAGTGLIGNISGTGVTISLSVPVIGSRGGTGHTTIAVGDLLVGGPSNTWTKLPTQNNSYLTTDSGGVMGWTTRSTRSYGRISTGISAVSGNSLTFGTSPTEVTGIPVPFTLDTLSTADFKMHATNGRLQYIGAETKTFICSATISTTNAGAGVLQIYKNGVSAAIGRGLLSGLCAPTGVAISLSTNDFLSLYVNFISGSAAPSIYTAQLCVESLSGF